MGAFKSRAARQNAANEQIDSVTTKGESVAFNVPSDDEDTQATTEPPPTYDEVVSGKLPTQSTAGQPFTQTLVVSQNTNIVIVDNGNNRQQKAKVTATVVIPIRISDENQEYGWLCKVLVKIYDWIFRRLTGNCCCLMYLPICLIMLPFLLFYWMVFIGCSCCRCFKCTKKLNCDFIREILFKNRPGNKKTTPGRVVVMYAILAFSLLVYGIVPPVVVKMLPKRDLESEVSTDKGPGYRYVPTSTLPMNKPDPTRSCADIKGTPCQVDGSSSTQDDTTLIFLWDCLSGQSWAFLTKQDSGSQNKLDGEEAGKEDLKTIVRVSVPPGASVFVEGTCSMQICYFGNERPSCRGKSFGKGSFVDRVPGSVEEFQEGLESG